MKDFETWNEEKQNIEYLTPDELPFHERDIWWCSIGINIGDEQDGKNEMFERPVLVLKKFNRKLAWVIPMTSQQKEGIHYHGLTYNNETSFVILSQLRLISTKRFQRFIRIITPHQFRIIKRKLVEFIKPF